MAMWKLLFLHQFLWISSLQSELHDLLSMTDEFYNEYYKTNDFTFDSEALKRMLKRTYNLEDEHRIYRRSAEEDEKLIQDTQGVYLLSNIEDVNKIPVKFPNDINILSTHNLLYITALEANGTNPENQLSNDLVLFHYSSIQGIRELERIPVLGGIKIASYSFQNTTYIIAAEYEAKENSDLFQGSTVYKMTEKNGRIFLEKIQTLNIIQPNDLKFWEHQDQFYLVVGTNMGNNSERTGTLIYRWLGHHFDCLQIIPSKNVKSVMPFTIGSFMYLAVANFQDEHGNLDIYSEIFLFNLQEMKFKTIQKLKTHGAHDVSYFNFENVESREKEHFLIIANKLGKNQDGILTSFKESVVYKFNDNYFIPFQSFRLHGATQWLPIKGPNNEFLLLASHTNGVVGYQYDGWRFTSVSLNFGQSFFGRNIQSMRTFYYFGDLFLTIADKSSYGNNINLWKLSFTSKNELEKYNREIEVWCSEMNMNMTQDDFNKVLNKFNFVFDDENPEQPESQLKSDNLLAEDFNQRIRDELERLNEKNKKLENMLEEAEELLEKHKTESELPIVLGSQEISSFEINCKSKDCCLFKRAKILKVNGENFADFMMNIAPLKENLATPVLEFEHVILEDDLSSSMVNGRPPEVFLDVSTDTFVNAELVVNGTVFINKNLTVNGMFDGVRPNAEHMLLSHGLQNIQEEIFVNNLKVKNLSITGLLNGEYIETLLHRPDINLPSDYDTLNVNNMFVEGLIDGYNLTEIFRDSLKNSGNQVLDGSLNIKSLEADEVVIDSEEVSNVSVSEILETLKEHLCQKDSLSNVESNSLEPEALSFKSYLSESESKNAENLADEYIVIIEGFLKAKEFSDESNSTSLSYIVNNSLKLNQSVIDSSFQFSDIKVNDLAVDFINKVPVKSWILKNSNDVINVYGEKIFMDAVHILDEVIADRINNVSLEELQRNVIRLDDDQNIAGDLKFNTVKCREINANFTNFGINTFDMKNRLEIKDSVLAERFEVENLTLTGNIDSISWEEILEDSVYEKDVVPEKKTIDGALRVENLNITGRLNNLFFEEFVALTSTEANKILLDRNVTLSKPLNVDELHFEGLLNYVLKPNFEREWLLQDETQIITGPVTFENVFMKSGSNLMNETVNNINLRKLFTKSIKINEDTKIKHLSSLGKVRAERIDIEGTFNNANFKESILRSKSEIPQTLFGDWFFSQGLTISGSLIVESFLSGLNMTHLCDLNPSDKINLIVGGSVSFQREPIILAEVNGLDLTTKAKEIWMRNENITLKGQNLRFNEVELDNKTTLLGFFNNVNLTDLSKFYLSKTHNRVISADYGFDTLVIKKWCRMHEAITGGPVNGLNLKYWAKNVLLQDEEQIIGENLRFEKFETLNLNTEKTVNGFDLSKDVLRLDVEDAVVEGEKTFQAINVLNLTLARGSTLQGVDIDFWRENSVKTTGDAVIEGDLVLENSTFNQPFKVLGKVNDMYFDSKHLLTTTRNQIVKGIKRFDYNNLPDPGMKIRSLEVSGPINGVDFDSLIKNQAYSDKNLTFSEPKTFTQGLVTNAMEVDGLFHGVNISKMCDDAFNPVDVNSQKDEYLNLLNQTKALIRVVKDRAFFFDYFELVQTLKPNIRAVVPTLKIGGNYLLAVFTANTMKFMDWNDFSDSFVNADEEFNLNDNISFVASEVTTNNSFLYIETTKSAKILEPTLLKEIEVTNTSCVASFKLKPLNKSCIFIGQKWNSSRILCNSFLMDDLQTYQWLDSKGSVQVATLIIEDETFIAAINKEVVFDKIENTLSIYRFDPKLQHFYVSHTLAEINPVALSSVTYKKDHYLVSAGGHLPESVHNSILSIFRFSRRHKVFVRAQSIQVDTPVDVHFAILPSSQLALYVLTSNPTKPFVVFLHKGITGFVEETSGLSLYPGSHLYSFTDLKNQHFVIISGFGRGQVLKAGFKGEKAII